MADIKTTIFHTVKPSVNVTSPFNSFFFREVGGSIRPMQSGLTHNVIKISVGCISVSQLANQSTPTRFAFCAFFNHPFGFSVLTNGYPLGVMVWNIDVSGTITKQKSLQVDEMSDYGVRFRAAVIMSRFFMVTEFLDDHPLDR
ncbi:uncharacterized protein LOC123670775 [Harmonia axyridis]|uniref:uncharacterized protein LOC123670775 n=1 Tax=Harmonia axyridis TaxID=115357 RepID=UPI001E2751B8|nr:uncharacterized protein LOC123670775 [Harmonia axyridis]